ncbi:MAG: leucine-rich repeat domain-containing protein [Lachnospiraceae bacterium]
MKKKIAFGIGAMIAMVLLVLLAGGYDSSRAQEDAAFQINNSTLVSYHGDDEVVVIPDGITTIGANAFAGNTNIRSVTVPEGVTAIEKGAFSGASKLQGISLPDSLRSIGDSAFDGCICLSAVSVGKGLNHLGNGVFSGCTSLSEVQFDVDNETFLCSDHCIFNKDKTILYQYLAGSPAQQYKIPDTIETIKEYAFWGCNHLKDVFLSASMDEIGDYAFANCQNLETVTVHEPLQRIGMGAFANAKELRQIHLPVSVTGIHPSAFTGCPIDLYITCPEDSYAAQFAQENNYPYGTEDLYLISYSTANAEVQNNSGSSARPVSNQADATAQNNSGEESNVQEEVKQEEEVTSSDSRSETVEGYPIGNSVVVSDRVFVMMDSLPVVSGGSSTAGNQSSSYEGTVSHSNDYAHYQDDNLEELPDLTDALSIGKLAFARSGITSAVIPEGITTIGYGAFYHCDDLQTVSIPSTVRRIDAYAFAFTPWYENWKQSGGEDFLIVGDGVLLAYKGSQQDVVIPDSVKYIAANAFQNNTFLVSVNLPQGLLDIGDSAFSGCVNLQQVNSVAALENAPSTAFEGCNL